MFCENCGNQMENGSKFCMSCGAKAEVQEVSQEASQEVAASVDTTPVQVQPEQPKPIQPQPEQPKPIQPQPLPPQAVRQQPPIVSQPTIAKKPVSVAPLPVWKYIGIFLLMCIPILGLVMILVWSFGDSCNQNTKNFARAVLIFAIISIIVSIVGYFTVGEYLSDILSGIGFPTV